MRCVWSGHPMWESCSGDATSFLRTAKGTLWPFCDACTEHHKVRSMRSYAEGGLATATMVKAQFDISINDPEALAAFAAQDPSKIGEVVENATRMWKTVQRLKGAL